MNKRALQTSRYSPGAVDPDVLERLFVGRDELLDEIVRKVRKSATSSDKHYMLLVGPRGIGKTHLIALVDHRIRNDEALSAARKKLALAYLSEEEWGIGSFLDFLVVVLRSLEREGPVGRERIDTVAALFARDPSAALAAAESLLIEVVGKRSLLLLCENLDQIFEGLGSEGQKRWRSFIQEHPFWIIIATTQALFRAVTLQRDPFFGFFTIRHLGSLTVEEAAELLRRKALVEGKRELAELLATATGRARVRAIHHLAGGNHRAYITLSEYLTKASLDDLSGPFLRMVDDLTPYYQGVLRQLTSPLQRKLIDWLCRRREPAAVKDIAQGCLVQPQSAAKQLGELARMNLVQGNRRGRETLYELAEPLMRICIEVKENRTEYLGIFVDLLRHWYSGKELTERASVVSGELDKVHLRAAIAEYGSSKSEPFLDLLHLEAQQCLRDDDYRGVAEAAGTRARELGNLEDHIDEAFAYLALGEIDEAERIVMDAAAHYPDAPPLTAVRARVLMERGDDRRALALLEALITPDSDDAHALEWRARVYLRLGRPEEALRDADRALGREPELDGALLVRAESLLQLGGLDAARDFALRAFRLTNGQPALALLARIAAKKGNEAEVTEHLRELAALEPMTPETLDRRADLLLLLGRFTEAVAAATQLYELYPDHSRALLIRSRARAALNDLEAATADADAYVARKPRSVIGWLFLVTLSLRMPSLERSLTALRQLRSMAPNVTRTELELEIIAAFGDGERRVQLFEEVDARHRTGNTIAARASGYLDVNRHAEAMALLETADLTEANPFWLAQLLRRLRLAGEHRLRNRVAAIALQRDDDHADLLFERAWFLVDTGRYQDALRHLDRSPQASAARAAALCGAEGLPAALRELGKLEPSERAPALRAVLEIEIRARGPMALARQISFVNEIAGEEAMAPALLALVRDLADRDELSSREWQDAASSIAEAMKGSEIGQLVGRLLVVACRYAIEKDAGVLLALPLEQRRLLIDEDEG